MCAQLLLSPTVVVTAAHCTEGTVGKTLVTFTSVIAYQPPSGFPLAATPATGFTQAEIEAAGFISGTAFTHPAYSGFTDNCPYLGGYQRLDIASVADWLASFVL